MIPIRRITVCLLLAVFVVATTAHALHVSLGERILLTKQFVNEVNERASGQWMASHDNGRLLRDRTLSEAKKLMGVMSMSQSFLPSRIFTKDEKAMEFPESFDSAEHWPQCTTIREIRDQSNCGSCWAIAAAEAISDRYCTVANQTNLRISTSNLLSCCFICGLGCKGGIPYLAWTWWTMVGLASEECQPYPFAPCGHHSTSDKYPACPSTVYDTPTCNSTCSNENVALQMYKGKSVYQVKGEEEYMRELMTNGPFEVALTVFEDFVTYKSGVYSHVVGSQLGGHAVRLVGWGVQDGIPYWKIANSWNDDWGANGYILVKRGSNECGIEESGVAGTP